MEKCKIKSCSNSGKLFNEKPLFYITLEDERSGCSYDDLTDKIGQEIELDIKPAKEYQGVQRYYFNLPKQTKNSKFSHKDYTFEKRRASLELSISACEKAGKIVTTENLLALSETFFEYLNKR